MTQSATFPVFEPAFVRQDWVLPRLLERQAIARADSVFLKWADDGPQYTYAQVNSRTNRLAHGLQRAGLQKGDVAVLFLPNSLDYLFIWFALNKIGAVQAPINTAYMGRFLEHQVNLCRAQVLFVDTQLLTHVRASIQAMPNLRRIVVCSGNEAPDAPQLPVPGCELLRLNELFTDREDNPGVPVEPSDISAIMFTSGTTGLSKGVLMPHAQCYLFSEIDRQSVQLTPDDVYMTALPLFHANAQLLTVYPCLIAGAKCVLYEKFSATQWVDRLHASGATVTNSLGVMLPFVYAQPPTVRDNTHQLKRMVCAPTPHGILDGFKKRFGVQGFAEGFGQTEICCPIMTPLALGLERPQGAAGLLLQQWFDVRIVDSDTDEELPVGEIGELLVRHKFPWTINAGYVGMPEETSRAWRNLWFHTGDAVKRDAFGWYYFVDRIKDAIRRRGENISSFEVEAPIRQHPDVADVAVVAVKSEHPGGEDEVKACVVVRAGATLAPATLVEWCETRLPAFAIPRYIEFLNAFPMTPSEKVKKGVLRSAGVTPGTWDRTLHPRSS